ncbi:MAG: hypothetical protein Q6373_011010 [Candidatus Sigynarchaeota archaeon]
MNDQEKEIWQELLAEERRSNWMHYEGETRWGFESLFIIFKQCLERLATWLVMRRPRGKTAEERETRPASQARAYPESKIIAPESTAAMQ